jgi:hypothetical protein
MRRQRGLVIDRREQVAGRRATAGWDDVTLGQDRARSSDWQTATAGNEHGPQTRM